MQSFGHCNDKQASVSEPKLELPASAQEAIRILAQGFSRYFGSRGSWPLVPKDPEK